MDEEKEDEEGLWDEITEEEGDEDEVDGERFEPEDPDTEGCGVLGFFNRTNEEFPMLSLRPAMIQDVKGSHYLPGNIEAILKIVHKRTGGKCHLKQRSAKNKPDHCHKGKLKQFKEMNYAEYEKQGEEYDFAIRVGIGMRNMRKTVVNTVGQTYKDKYNMTNPCYITKKRKEIVCLL